MTEDTTRKREIEGLIEASQETGCNNLLIITAEEEEMIEVDDVRRIKVVPAWKWLLGRK